MGCEQSCILRKPQSTKGEHALSRRKGSTLENLSRKLRLSIGNESTVWSPLADNTRKESLLSPTACDDQLDSRRSSNQDCNSAILGIERPDLKNSFHEFELDVLDSTWPLIYEKALENGLSIINLALDIFPLLRYIFDSE
ncbi:hypothetical protein Ciccas_014161 [Cichlidogyrus casuarinus]|uniref:Uncharacterized protein n=1 Tax=Cichlidogyrus casuarinus TaxID=1844966 RepID=A0ABD2PJJ4_9PLAT